MFPGPVLQKVSERRGVGGRGARWGCRVIVSFQVSHGTDAQGRGQIPGLRATGAPSRVGTAENGGGRGGGQTRALLGRQEGKEKGWAGGVSTGPAQPVGCGGQPVTDTAQAAGLAPSEGGRGCRGRWGGVWGGGRKDHTAFPIPDLSSGSKASGHASSPEGQSSGQNQPSLFRMV